MLLDLPDDILLNITAYFAPVDLLALRQTCRVLHAFTSLDYVWHHLSIDIPLNIPPDSSISSLSGVIIQRIVTRALCLDSNWRNRDPLFNCTQITQPNEFKNATIMQLQLLGRTHVMILSRWPSHDELSAWRLDELPDSRTYVGLKVIIPMIQFAATTRVRNCDATVVFLSNNEAVSIYSLSLHFLSDQPYMLCKSIPGPSEGRISVVEICNDITATVVARIPSNFGPPTYTAIFYNIPNKRKFFHEFSSHISLDRLQIKLYPKCFILTGVRNDALVVRIHALPQDLYVKDDFMDVTILSAEQCRLLAEYVLSSVSRLCEFYISTEPVYEHPSHFSLIVFHSFGEHTKGTADVYQVPINGTEGGIQCNTYTRTHRFKTAIGTRPEIVCMGKTGYRAVWLDHEWESDEHRLWKATFRPGDPAIVDPLVPPHHPLPFEAHMIASLSFEEATGRVCVGLRTGAVYILEF